MALSILRAGSWDRWGQERRYRRQQGPQLEHSTRRSDWLERVVAEGSPVFVPAPGDSC